MPTEPTTPTGQADPKTGTAAPAPASKARPDSRLLAHAAALFRADLDLDQSIPTEQSGRT